MMQPQRSFWQFAVSLYGFAGVQPLLLSWQDDHGLEVTLLLWALWLDLQGKPRDTQLWQQGVSSSAGGRERVERWRRWRRRCPRWLTLLRRWLLRRELQQEQRVIDSLQRLTPGAEIRPEATEGLQLQNSEWLLRERGLQAGQPQLESLVQHWLSVQIRS